MDEGNNKLCHINENNTSQDWCIDVDKGRDLQLIGMNRILVSTDKGF